MLTRSFVLALTALLLPLSAADRITPVNGASIAIVGGGQGARMTNDPSFETEVYLRYAQKNVVIRNMCDDGDTPAYRPHAARNNPYAFPGAEKFRPIPSTQDRWGAINVGNGFNETPDEWLTRVKADVVIGMFGYIESYRGADKIELYKEGLTAWLKHTAQQKYNGKSAPVVVLVSPPALEKQSDASVNLALYAQAIGEVAAANNVLFVDAYTASKAWYKASAKPLTRDGWAYNADGFAKLGPFLAESIFADSPSAGNRDAIAAAVTEKNWLWDMWFKVPNGVHVYGRRHNPHGKLNYPHELIKLEEMTGIRDQAIWAAANGESFDVAAADAKTHVVPDIETNYKPSNKNGTTEYLYGADAEATIATPEGYKVELFASEKEFPDLANPVQVAFDNQGRLWVAVMPAYPHWKPGDPKANDKLLIFEDTNNDGKADKQTVFADGLHLPIGFEFAPEGVYVSNGKQLLLLRDDNDDDKADGIEVVLQGFDDHDTHHAAGAFCADPSGAFYMSEGTFLHSHVETADGPARSSAGGFYRYSPREQSLERTVRVTIPNPWGVAFDEYGQDFFAHTSGTAINWMSPSSMKVPFGYLAPLTPDLAPSDAKVRPTSGLEFVSSSHFPDEVQGDMLIGNAIGFLGIKQHAVSENGPGYKLTFRQDLVSASDGNFRPVDFEFAPDGSLYFIDWHNTLIGHMQHNSRDPLRDHVHGRIYRVTYPSRPLVKPAKVASASIDELFDNLMLPEYRTRYRTRRELRGRPVEAVVAGLQKYVQRIPAHADKREHHVLEGLWVSWGIGAVDEGLLRQSLTAKDHRIRAAAVRVLRYTHDQIEDAQALMIAAAADDHGRVRLEAVNGASWISNEVGKAVLAEALKHDVDASWMKPAYDSVAAILDGTPLVPKTKRKVKTHLKGGAKKLFMKGHEIYNEEGHCATCHQEDGKGLPEAQFPPLAKTKWVQGSPERLIRLTLHGLMGPIEVRKKQYPGIVPMTAFKHLSDEEIAAVLTYVRNAFGNKADPISPAQVKEQRAATADVTSFLSPAELLKEFPH